MVSLFCSYLSILAWLDVRLGDMGVSERERMAAWLV